jgi:hypothetical protein
MPIQRRSFVPRVNVPSGELGNLLMLQGERRAESRRRQGDISARMWTNLGKQVSDSVMGYAKWKEEEPDRQIARESAQLNLDALQHNANRRDELEIRDDKAWQQQLDAWTREADTRAAWSKAYVQAEDGTWGLDEDLLTAALAESGNGDLIGPALTASRQMQKDALELKNATEDNEDQFRAKALQTAVQAISMSEYDPGVASLIVDGLERNKVIPAETAAYIRERITDPNSIRAMIRDLQNPGGQPDLTVLPRGSSLVNPNDGSVVASNPYVSTAGSRGSLTQQLFDAIADGDREAVDNIIQAMQQGGAAGRPPQEMSPQELAQATNDIRSDIATRIDRARNHTWTAINEVRNGGWTPTEKEAEIQRLQEELAQLEADAQRAGQEMIAAIQPQGQEDPGGGEPVNAYAVNNILIITGGPEAGRYELGSAEEAKATAERVKAGR